MAFSWKSSWLIVDAAQGDGTMHAEVSTAKQRNGAQMKQSRMSRVAGLVLTGLLSFVLVASAYMKFTLDPNSSTGQEFANNVPLTLLKPLALSEIGLLALVWAPRTAALGYVLMFGYWSGAMATHLTHSSPVTVQPVLMVLTLVASFFRSPELFARLLGRRVDSV